MRKFLKILFRWTEFLLAAGGLGLLYWLAQKVGFETLKQNFLTFGVSWTLFLILFYTLSQIAFCAAWFVLLDRTAGRPTFLDTFRAYAAGDALNMTVPSANLAGEPVKVMLLRGIVPTQAAVTSVTVYKFADLVSMTLFLALGWLLHFAFYNLPLSWNLGAGVVVFGMGGTCLFLYTLQHRGIYGPLRDRFLKSVFTRWLFEKLSSAHLIDESIRAFYRDHPRRFRLSVFYNFLAWFGGVLEILFFMKVTGQPVSFAAAFTIETFSMFINNVIFFVPARLGVGEGGRVLLFYTLGYPASSGLAYGIIRRIRELAWIGLGFLILLFRPREKAAV